jgi:hypothetical protein
MVEITNELMYEVLKSVQAHVARIREDVTTVKSRMTSLDHRLGIIHTDMALFADRMAGSKAVWSASRHASTSPTREGDVRNHQRTHL